MKGLEISKAYYLQYGKPMLEQEFPQVCDRIAVGLVGEGSECLGFDDELSKDHDFDAGFCLFITREDEREFGFRLERAYAKLPKEFMGLKRAHLSPVGGNRHGVQIIEDFYAKYLGAETPPEDNLRWLYTPSQALACATGGEVFSDPLGRFSEIRAALSSGYPEDVRRKKIAAHTIFMAQAGQYNYGRCISRTEYGAAQLAVFEFVRHAISAIYLLNRRYEPFYKWVYRGLRDLPLLPELEPELLWLTEAGHQSEENIKKTEIIEYISAVLIAEFEQQGLTKAGCNNLETHAYSILDSVKDGQLRNMHIMEGA